MARTIFLLLMLLNLCVFAWVYMTSDERALVGREPERLKAQIAAEHIRLVELPVSGLSPAMAEVPIAPTASASASLSSVSVESCNSYTGTTIAEAQQIARSLAEKFPATRVVVSPLAARTVYELVIDGFSTRVQAEARLADLKRLGTHQNITVRVEEKGFSLLLSSFDERKLADEAARETGKNGVRFAHVAERKTATDLASLDVHGSDTLLKKLPELMAPLKVLIQTPCAVL